MASGGNRTPSIDNAEHIGPNDTGDNIEAKRVASYIWDGSAWIRATAASSGGATEYTSGDATTANPVGGIQVFDNAGTITAVSDVNPLPVDATVNASVDLGDQNIGNATAATQRVVLASDQPSVTVDDGGSSLTVDGTVTANAGTGTFAISASSLPLPTGAATAANQQTDALTDTELRATPVVVDLGANNDVTVTSGTVTANLGATDNAVLDDIAANQTDNSQKTQLVDASGNAVTVTGNKLDVNATASLAGTTLPIASATEAVGVAIVDSSGNQISSFGGGTQYTEGDTDATFTGTMSLVEGAANAAATLKQPTTPSDTQPISASALPLPSGAATAANQTTANSSLSSIDSALAGTLTVDASGTAVPITDNGGSITVDGTFWQATQPVSAASLPLPSGAATSAKQPALGTAGTASSDVITVQGIASMTALKVDGSATTQPVSASSLPLPTGAATAANQQTDALTDTELRATPVVVDLGANNDVTVTGTVTVDGSGVTQPVSGTVTANLSNTDNAVLDSIDEAVSSKQITGIGHGVKTVASAGTDEALAGSTVCKRVTIMAQTDNTNPVAIGGSGVDATVATGTGILLFPGDAYELDIDNLADIYVDAITSGEGVRYVYFT